MSSTSSSDQQNNNLVVNKQGFNSGTLMISSDHSSGSSFVAQAQQQQQDYQQQQFYSVPHQSQQQFYQHSTASIGQPQQQIYATQQHPTGQQIYTPHRSIQSPPQHFVQIHSPQQIFYGQVQGGQQQHFDHQIGGQSAHVNQFYEGPSQHQEEEILMEEGEASNMIVAETCTVETSSPSPDFDNEHPPQLTKQSYYGRQQPIVMATMAQPSVGSGAGQPMQAGAYYMQPVHRNSHPSSQPGYIIMPTYSAYPGSSHQQQIAQQQSRQIVGQNPNLLQTTQHQTTAGHIIRRTTPFEEEEEEEDDDEEQQQQIGHQSSNNRLHTLSLPQITQTSKKVGGYPQQQKQPNVNVNEPRMTRAGRRKQIFESKTTKIVSGRKGNNEDIGGEIQSDEGTAKMVKKTSNATTPKKDNSQPAKPLLDKGIVHIQAVQRVATPEGWRRMNDWLKGAIKTMDLAKLRQLMNQLIDADISVDLLRANDTPKLIKDLQKCADKDIANMTTKMVTKWKQSVREGNNSEKQNQKIMAKSGTATTVGNGTAAATGKHLRRNSQSMDSDGGDEQSTSSNSNTAQKGGSSVIQTRGRTSSITAALSSAGDSSQQQIGTRTNSFGGGSSTASSTIADGSVPVEKPKTTAKAKAKISRPRLTGLEGDDDNNTNTTQSAKQPPLCKRLSATGKTSISPTTAISESPLTKIMAATAKFQAQQQPKRKPVDVMFSDGFMDSLSAADNVRPKKPKIVRRKLNPLPAAGNGGTSTAAGGSGTKNDSTAGVSDSPIDSSSLTSGGGGNGGGRRVRFIDEVGRELVEVRNFEIEEGERINVTKLDKEQIKHFDSQQEKMLLMNSGFGRRPGPGTAGGPTVGVSGAFSSLTDPSLMPPGHGRNIFGMPIPPSINQIGIPPPPPMRIPFGIMATKGPIAAAGAINSGKYPYKLIPVDHKPVIEPGNKSVSKEIELERQKTTMSALILPTPLPISDLDEQEWKRHREESLNHMPKIIPLELITEIIEQKGINRVKMETSIKKEEAAQIGMGREEPMEIVDEAKKVVKNTVKAELEKMEEDTPLSPARPQVRRISSDEESDVDMADESMKKEEKEEREDLIASPEPEPLNSSLDESTDSIKEIPIDKVRTSTEEEDEEEDLDIRDIQQTGQQQMEAQKSQSKLLVASSSTSIQEFLKKSSPQVISLLKNLNTTLGSDVTAAKGQDGTNKQEMGAKSIDQSATSTMTSSSIPVIGGTISSPSIPPPPTHLYPHRPPISGQFGSSISMPTPPRGLPPHIQQMMIRTSSAGPIPFPPPNFSTPPPPIGQRPSFTLPTTSVQFQMGQNVPLPQQSAQKVPPIPPIGLMQMPQISSQQKKVTTQSQDETKNKTEDSTTISTSTISTGSLQQSKGGSPTSPGPPGLDVGGSTPPAPEQLAATVQAQQQGGQSPMITPADAQTGQQSTQQPQISPQAAPTPQQPVMSLQEARNVAGVCNYFMRFNKCNFGDQCKFAHDEQTMTKGVQMAMSGVSIGGRGGMIRGCGSRGRGGSSGRGGNAFRTTGTDGGGSGSGGGGFDDRRQRRGGGFGSGGGGRDYDLSPIRDGSSNVGKGGGGGGYRDRRFRHQSPRRRRGGYSSRSRSRDRYSRRRRTRSRSRSRERAGRDRDCNRDRRRSRSASKSSSSSASTYSRSPSPIRDRNKEGRQRGRRQSGDNSGRRDKRNNDRRTERNDPWEEKKSSPSRQQSTNSSSSSSSSTPNQEENEKQHQKQAEENRPTSGNGGDQGINDPQEEQQEQLQKGLIEAVSDEVQIIE